MKRPVLLVAKREIVTRVRQRSFKVITGLTIAGVVGFIALAGIKGNETKSYKVAVTPDVSAPLRTHVEGIGEALNADVRITEVPHRDAAVGTVRSEAANFALIGTSEIIVDRGVPPQDISPRGRFVLAMTETVRLHGGLAGQGLSPEAASAALSSEPPPVTALEPAPPQTRGRVATQVGLTLVYLMVLQYPMWLLISIAREKGTRLVELLLSTLRPSQLLAGKLLGMNALAVAHAGVLGLVALGAGLVVGRETTAAFNLDLKTVLWTFAWLVVGLALYSAVYAVAGSMTGRDESSPTGPVFMLVLAGYFSANLTVGGGDVGWYAPILAFIPFTAPFMMLALIGLDAVPMWQAFLSLGIAVVSVPMVLKGAAAVYASAVVRTGQKTKWSDVLRPWRLKRQAA